STPFADDFNSATRQQLDTHWNEKFGNFKADASGNITAVSYTATDMTITSNGHGLEAGQAVTLSNMNGLTGATGTFTITAVSTNTFTVAISGVSGTYTSGGTWTQYTLKNNTNAAMAVLNLTPETDVAVSAKFAVAANSGSASGLVARYSGPG